jgi:uncharacterized protein (DUF1810 family)
MDTQARRASALTTARVTEERTMAADESDTLERFRQAQRNPGAGFEAALAEIQSGHKRGHWIWYVFPQLAGLGHSSMSQAYAIADAEEAAAYLRDATLSARLLAITAAVADHVRGGSPLATVMGSEVDAVKLVSSLTLFERVAASVGGTGPKDTCRALAGLAAEILDRAAAEGYPRCAFTARVLRGE